MTLEEAYQRKGQLQTSIEIAQAQMQVVNQEIVRLLNVNPQNGNKGLSEPIAGIDGK